MRASLILAVALTALVADASAAGFPAPDRPVADIVAGIWSEAAHRNGADEAGQLVRRLGIVPGMGVADVGAGAGYLTTRLSPVVGPTGRIYAQDVMAEYLDEARREAGRQGLTNVTFVLGAADDPKLPPASADRVVMAHMYHEVAQPYGLLWNLVPALRPGALVAVTDFNRRLEHHGTPPALLKCEFEAVGYRQVSFAELDGGVGYLAVFAPPAAEARPAPESIKPCRL